MDDEAQEAAEQYAQVDTPALTAEEAREAQRREERRAKRKIGIIARSTEPPWGRVKSLRALSTSAMASSTAASAMDLRLLFLIFPSPFVLPRAK